MPGAALRRQGHRLHRHQDAAGPALPARPAAGARRAGAAGDAGAAQGPRQLRLPPPPRARRARRAACPRATTRATCRRSSPSRAPARRGDRGELADVPERASIWPLVTSTRDNCLGSECAYHGDCFVLKARKAALEADVVVVNHHLFFADVMLRDEGLAELLPACNTVDPRRGAPAAGHRDAVLRRAGRRRASSPSSRATPRSPRAPARARSPTCPTPPPASAPAIRKLRLALGDAPGKLAARRRALRATGFADALDELAAALDRLGDRARAASPSAARSSRNARSRADERRARCSRAGATPGTAEPRHGRTTPPARWIRWVDVTPHGLAAARVAAVGRRRSSAGRSSAVGPRVDLHVGDAGGRPRLLALPARARARPTRRPGCWDSPFDYATQALLYVPRGLPAPNSPRAHRGGRRRRAAGAARRAAAARSCCSRRCAR